MAPKADHNITSDIANHSVKLILFAVRNKGLFNQKKHLLGTLNEKWAGPFGPAHSFNTHPMMPICNADGISLLVRTAD